MYVPMKMNFSIDAIAYQLLSMFLVNVRYAKLLCLYLDVRCVLNDFDDIFSIMNLSLIYSSLLCHIPSWWYVHASVEVLFMTTSMSYNFFIYYFLCFVLKCS